MHDSNFEVVSKIFSYPLNLLQKLKLVILGSEESTVFNISALLKNCLNLENLSITGPKYLFKTPLFPDTLPRFTKLRSLCVCICYCSEEFLADFISRSPILNVLLSNQPHKLNRDIVLSLYCNFNINLKTITTKDYSKYKFVAAVEKGNANSGT